MNARYVHRALRTAPVVFSQADPHEALGEIRKLPSLAQSLFRCHAAERFNIQPMIRAGLAVHESIICERDENVRTKKSPRAPPALSTRPAGERARRCSTHAQPSGVPRLAMRGSRQTR